MYQCNPMMATLQ